MSEAYLILKKNDGILQQDGIGKPPLNTKLNAGPLYI